MQTYLQENFSHAKVSAELSNPDSLCFIAWEGHFYEKNGFIAFDKHAFQFGEDEQIDVMIEKLLDWRFSFQRQLDSKQVTS